MIDDIVLWPKRDRYLTMSVLTKWRRSDLLLTVRTLTIPKGELITAWYRVHESHALLVDDKYIGKLPAQISVQGLRHNSQLHLLTSLVNVADTHTIPFVYDAVGTRYNQTATRGTGFLIGNEDLLLGHTFDGDNQFILDLSSGFSCLQALHRQRKKTITDSHITLDTYKQYAMPLNDTSIHNIYRLPRRNGRRKVK